jgi:aspartyl-tRNA(Asn)/glutamyl-tRNA(Gln) amidotransferase subunit C
MKRKTRKTLTIKEVEHVALLANLKLNKTELRKFQKQLSEILGYIEVLNKLKAEKIEPTSQVTGLENVFRKDEIKPSLSQKEVLSNAKEKHDNFFKTKAIFEER